MNEIMKSVSIIIPAYKEEDFIEKTITCLLDSFRGKDLKFEIIVIIDSVPEDNTLQIVEDLAKNNTEIIMIKRKGKHGVANAIKTGIQKAINETIMIIMADNSEKSDDLLKIVIKMNEGYDMVFENRFMGDAHIEGYVFKKLIANRLCNFAIRVLFGIKSSDITNAVKIYKTIALKNIDITSTGFEVFVELPVKSYINGYRNFAEIPLNHFARDESLSNLNLSKEGPRYFKMVLKLFFRK